MKISSRVLDLSLEKETYADIEDNERSVIGFVARLVALNSYTQLKTVVLRIMYTNYRPLKFASRFSKNAATPSRWSSV